MLAAEPPGACDLLPCRALGVRYTNPEVFMKRAFLLCPALCAAILYGQNDPKPDVDKPDDPLSSATFAGLKLRSIGPAITSGRVTSFAVDPHNRSHYFVGVASGGVWKTTNSGATFTPVFDNEGSYSIGVV